jgi:hypothetical protein
VWRGVRARPHPRHRPRRSMPGEAAQPLAKGVQGREATKGTGAALRNVPDSILPTRGTTGKQCARGRHSRRRRRRAVGCGRRSSVRMWPAGAVPPSPGHLRTCVNTCTNRFTLMTSQDSQPRRTATGLSREGGQPTLSRAVVATIALLTLKLTLRQALLPPLTSLYCMKAGGESSSPAVYLSARWWLNSRCAASSARTCRSTSRTVASGARR